MQLESARERARPFVLEPAAPGVACQEGLRPYLLSRARSRGVADTRSVNPLTDEILFAWLERGVTVRIGLETQLAFFTPAAETVDR